MTDTLQATVEFSVDLCRLHNVDLFQRGRYQICAQLSLAANYIHTVEVVCCDEHVQCTPQSPTAYASSSPIAGAAGASDMNGSVCGRLALSRIVPVLYRNEEISLNNMFRFRCDILLPPDVAASAKKSSEIHDESSVASLLEAAQFRLEVGLLFAEMSSTVNDSYYHGDNLSQRHSHKLTRAPTTSGSCEGATSPHASPLAGDTASLQLVSVRTLHLHFSPHCGLHYHLPVLFDYHHLAAVSLTIHASLMAVHWRPSAELLSLASAKIATPIAASAAKQGSSQSGASVGSGPLSGSNRAGSKKSSISKATVTCSVRRLRRFNGCTKAASTSSYAYGDTVDSDETEQDICDGRGCDSGADTATTTTSECRDNSAAKLRQERLMRQRHVDTCSILLACIDSLHTHTHTLSVQLRQPHAGACVCHTDNNTNRSSRSSSSRCDICAHNFSDSRVNRSLSSSAPCQLTGDSVSEKYRRRLRELCVALSDIPAHLLAERSRLAESHVKQLNRLATGSWHTFLALATGSCARRHHVQERLARRHHALRVRRFSEVFFVSTVPRTVSVATGCYGDDSASRHAQATSALRCNAYLRHLPPLPVECVPSDGLARSMPIIYEERYCPVSEFFAGGEKLANKRDSFGCDNMDTVKGSAATTMSKIIRAGNRSANFTGAQCGRRKVKRNNHPGLLPTGGESSCHYDTGRAANRTTPSVHYSATAILSPSNSREPHQKLLQPPTEQQLAKHLDSVSLCGRDVYHSGNSLDMQRHYQQHQGGSFRLQHTLSLLALPRGNGAPLPRRRRFAASSDSRRHSTQYQRHNASGTLERKRQFGTSRYVSTTTATTSITASISSSSSDSGSINVDCISNTEQMPIQTFSGGAHRKLARDNYSSSLPDLHSTSSSSSSASTNGCVSFSGLASGPGDSSFSSVSLCAPLKGPRAARIQYRGAPDGAMETVARSVSAGVFAARCNGSLAASHGHCRIVCDGDAVENSTYTAPWCRHSCLGVSTDHYMLFAESMDDGGVVGGGDGRVINESRGYEVSCDCYSAALCGQGDPTLQQHHLSALGRTTARFVAAKRAFLAEWSTHLTAKVYADCARTSADMSLPYFTPPISEHWLLERASCEGRRGVHLVVCVHGLDGTCADLRLVRAYLQLAMGGCGDVPRRGRPEYAHVRTRLAFLMSSANQGDTFSDLQTLSDRLVEEICRFVADDLSGVLPTRLSFIGHSLGCVIAHSALSHPQMACYLNRLHTFLSLSGPHLGLLYNNSGLVQAGLWLMQRVKQSTALRQLVMRDASDVRQTFLYRLARGSQLYRFRHVLLVGSGQDKYVPLHSARIELCRTAVRDRTTSGAAYREMVQLIVGPMVERSSVSLVRYNVHHALGRSTSALIGRAAHVASLDSELFIEKFILVSALKYFK